MVPLKLGLPPRRRLTLLCLGAHSDDIEIGCGGTVLRLLAERPNVTVHWIVLSARGARAREARRSAARLLRRARHSTVVVESFRDGFFPYEGTAIKEFIEHVKTGITPDLILTHHGADRHQDHRVVSELTWNTFRDHLILEYEIPKYDGDLGTPNTYVALDASIRRRKLRHIMTAFASQRGKRWFTEDTFLGLMRLRGVEAACPEGFAEAFYGRKVLVGL